MAIPELIMNSILKTYNILLKEEHIKITDAKKLKLENHLYYDLVCGVKVSKYLAKIIAFNV